MPDPERSLTIGIDGRELQGRSTGTGRYLRSLIRAWTRRGSDRLIVYCAGAPSEDPVLGHPSVRARAVGVAGAGGLAWQERLLPRAAAEDQLDAFFAPSYWCPLSLSLPRVTTVHDLSVFSVPEDFSLYEAARRRLLVSLSVRASRRIIAVSEFTRREILGRFPAAAGRVLHVPHGPDDDLPAPPGREDARRRLSISGPYLLSVGSVLNRRRVPELLQAMRLLAGRWPTAVLDVVGENRTHPRLDLNALVDRHGLGSRVRLSGFVGEPGLADRYAAADAAVYLSDYEGFGLPVLEAMARGIPVVAGDRPALNQVFAGAAIFADAGDPEAIASALAILLDDPRRRAQLVERGRSVAGRHSWDRAAAQTREALAAAVMEGP